MLTGLYQDLTLPTPPYPPNVWLSIPEQVAKYGYEFEEHTILTEDGFLLTAFRIPRKIGQHNNASKTPVYMQHGLLDDGGTFIFNNNSLDLSFDLVDRGYDVWITNSRGTVFSN